MILGFVSAKYARQVGRIKPRASAAEPDAVTDTSFSLPVAKQLDTQAICRGHWIPLLRE
jgi:hypothetical protein